MNWLAHLFLSEPDIESRLGNLLADAIKGRDRLALPPAMQRGMRRHQQIDSFTDFHPVVARSRSRISGEYRRVAGILVDIFYDHFLALHWDKYAAQSLRGFTDGFYREVEALKIELPVIAQEMLASIIREDRLASYARIEGIDAALRRLTLHIQSRTGRSFELEKATPQLREHFEGFESDFTEFFPEMRMHVEKFEP